MSPNATVPISARTVSEKARSKRRSYSSMLHGDGSKHLDELDPELLGLECEQRAADTVMADPVEGLGRRGDQRPRLEVLLSERPECERGVLAAAPGQREPGHQPIMSRLCQRARSAPFDRDEVEALIELVIDGRTPDG